MGGVGQIKRNAITGGLAQRHPPGSRPVTPSA